MEANVDLICKLLDGMRIKHSYIGYRYIRDTIILGVKIDNAIKITELYKEVAAMNNSKWISVDRAIRYCLHSSGFDVTNKEFLLKIIDYLQVKNYSDLDVKDNVIFLKSIEKKREWYQ
jgi:Sporulation initiation factor Spo0A C terminal.